MIQIYAIIGLSLAVLGLGWYAKYETEQAGAEKSARMTAEAVAKNNDEQVDILQKAIVIREAETAKQLANEAKGRRRAEAIISEITHAEDAPTAPALSLAIERVRNNVRNPASDGKDGKGVPNPNGSGGSSDNSR